MEGSDRPLVFETRHGWVCSHWGVRTYGKTAEEACYRWRITHMGRCAQVKRERMLSGELAAG